MKKHIEQAKEIIAQTLRRFDAGRIALAWSGGKDSTVLLHLVLQVAPPSSFKVFFIDTSLKFPEIQAFTKHVAKDWGVDVLTVRNLEALRRMKPAVDKVECCNLLKTIPLGNAIRRHGIQALMAAVRADEHPSRARETHFSPRTAPPHTRVHPLLDFSESDIWGYIQANGLPYCSLYDQGYRSLGCMPCTVKGGQDGERSGRDADKEAHMAKLRDLGYF